MTDHARPITRLAIDPALVLRRLNDWRELIERRVPAHAPSERYLQETIESKLRPCMSSRPGSAMRREYELGPEDRVDFFIQEPNPTHPTVGGPGLRASIGLGIEVKVDGSLSALLRQLQRYAQHDSIDGLLVVSTRAHHRDLPATLSDKPVVVASLLFGGL